ncbi:hypothetical protein D3C74_438870 [compost metagenome]
MSTPVMKMSSSASAARLSAGSSLRTCSMDMPRRNRKYSEVMAPVRVITAQ